MLSDQLTVKVESEGSPKTRLTYSASRASEQSSNWAVKQKCSEGKEQDQPLAEFRPILPETDYLSFSFVAEDFYCSLPSLCFSPVIRRLQRNDGGCWLFTDQVVSRWHHSHPQSPPRRKPVARSLFPPTVHRVPPYQRLLAALLLLWVNHIDIMGPNDDGRC